MRGRGEVTPPYLSRSPSTGMAGPLGRGWSVWGENLVGIGRRRPEPHTVQGKPCSCVNAFTPPVPGPRGLLLRIRDGERRGVFLGKLLTVMEGCDAACLLLQETCVTSDGWQVCIPGYRVHGQRHGRISWDSPRVMSGTPFMSIPARGGNSLTSSRGFVSMLTVSTRRDPTPRMVFLGDFN
jgi:hypothetical protein